MYFVDFWSPFSTCQLYLQAGNSKQRHQALTVSTTNIVMANRESYSYCCCSCCCSCYVMSGTYSASYRFDIHRLLLPATRCLRRCFDCRFYLDSTRFTSRHPLGKQAAAVLFGCHFCCFWLPTAVDFAFVVIVERTSVATDGFSRPHPHQAAKRFVVKCHLHRLCSAQIFVLVLENTCLLLLLFDCYCCCFVMLATHCWCWQTKQSYKPQLRSQAFGTLHPTTTTVTMRCI